MKLSRSIIAVTGATGFLGGYLVDKLLARGAHVVAAVRNPAKAADLAARGVEVRRADLSEPDALTEAFRGADAVISNAAIVSFTNPRATHATNVEGTRNVFQAIARAGVKRAVAISSAAAYAPSAFARDEQAALRTRARFIWDSYGASKAEAERVAAALCDQHGVQLTIFRPCGISGRKDPLLVESLRKLARFKVAPFPVFTRIGVVHAEDVAEAVALALENESIAAGKAYNLQGDTVSLWRVADAFRAAGGPSVRLRIPVPLPFLLRYDDTKARRELGWQPRDINRTCADAVTQR